MNQLLPDLRSASESTSVLTALSTRSSITASDVAALRRTELSSGIGAQADAELMIAIERGRAAKCREWGDLLVESLVDYIVWAERPTGVLTDDQAAWLCEHLGETPSPASLAVLIAVLEEAGTVPHWFGAAVRLRASRVFGSDAWMPRQKAA
jgi:hypothetical protein